MTQFVDPQHIEIITAAAEQVLADDGCWCPDSFAHTDDQCFPHLVLGLLRPTVEAWEPTL